MSALLVVVPLLLLAAAPVAWIAGKRWPRLAGWIVVAASAASLVALLPLGGLEVEASAPWMRIGRWSLALTLRSDGLGFLVAVTVASVALLVNLYSVGYTEGDEDRPRFFAWMAFFAGSMLTLVLAGSLILLFAAWEAVGLASWALIGFWYRDEAARRAAARAFLITRIGDVGFLLAIVLVLLRTGTSDVELFLFLRQIGLVSAPLAAMIAGFLVFAALAKSAQIPFSAWLPDAMVGPSPVSALLHAATMVIAGAYLLVRLFPLYAALPDVLAAIRWLGAITALAAAITATAQRDLKRVLAWSTISQIGEMFFAVGLGAPIAATHHLIVHAAYKSALFLAAGAVQHATGTRDLGELGGLLGRMPWTAAAFATSALALAGVPPLSGYFSEEAILAAAAVAHPGWAVLSIALFALAGVYIGRAAWATFGPWTDARAPEAHDPGGRMLAPTVILAISAIVIGGLVKSPLHELLRYADAARSPGLGWRAIAVLASLAGLTFGAWRVRARGPVPALGEAASLPGRWLDEAADWGQAWAMRLAARADAIERGFTEAGDDLAGAAVRLATKGREIEQGFADAGDDLTSAAMRLAAVDRGIEQGFADAGDDLAAAAVRAASVDREIERWGFRAGFDDLAMSLARAGGTLRRLESGKLYLYTLGLFASLLAGAALAIAIWW